MKKQIKRLISVLLIGSILSTFGAVNSFAEEIKVDDQTTAEIISGDYSLYNDLVLWTHFKDFRNSKCILRNV